MHPCASSFSYKDISHVGLGTNHMTSFHLHYLFRGSISLYSHILRYLRVGGVCVIQTITDGKVLAYALFIKGGAKRKLNAEEKIGKIEVWGNKNTIT